jgi:co-chaperonin GroES (HSP10)
MVNDSGLIPTEFCVVVEMDAAPDKVGSILMPTQVADRDKLAADEGTLVAVSPLAFTYDNWPEGSRKPEVGDRVVFRKFAGLLRTNKENGKDFRLLNDKDIVAIVETVPHDKPLNPRLGTVSGGVGKALPQFQRPTDGQGSFSDERVGY